MSWGDLGCPIIVDNDVIMAVRLIRHLYWDLGQGAGGPLHAQLDDGNLDDQFLEFEPQRYNYLFDGTWKRWAQAGEDTSMARATEIMETCEEICRYLRSMTLAQRYSAVAWAHGDVERYVTRMGSAIDSAAGSSGPRGARI